MRSKMHFGAPASAFQRAALLRYHSTPAEELLWEHLRKNKAGCKFRRQHPLKHFVVDFYCHFYRLAIEVDGGIHEEQDQQVIDQEKESGLQNLGIHLLRLTNEAVLFDIETTMTKIHQIMLELKCHNPNEPPRFFK